MQERPERSHHLRVNLWILPHTRFLLVSNAGLDTGHKVLMPGASSSVDYLSTLKDRAQGASTKSLFSVTLSRLDVH